MFTLKFFMFRLNYVFATNYMFSMCLRMIFTPFPGVPVISEDAVFHLEKHIIAPLTIVLPGNIKRLSSCDNTMKCNIAPDTD